MKQTDFRDVPDELWERIEPLLAPFKRKRSGGSKPLAQRTVLAGILYKCRTSSKCLLYNNWIEYVEVIFTKIFI